MRKLLTTLCLSVSISSAYATTNQDIGADNIIMVVADGMGPTYTTAYRYFQDNPETNKVETTIFDKYLVGTSSTYPAKMSGYVTDSAASATALSTGVKSYNGAIGVDVNKKPLLTVLEHAKTLNMKTGVVVTSQVNHATPASYLAHNESRKNYDAIANSYVDEKINNNVKFDVLLGGGWKYFIREDRNLVEELQQQGFQYVDKYDDLANLRVGKPALGLFADVGLPWALDDEKGRLANMTSHALRLLDNDKPFFMLVEASQVDWAGHSNDIAAALLEMADLDATMQVLEQFVAKNPNTTVILTADHSTGGVTLGVNGDYLWKPEIIHRMKHSPNFIAKQLSEEKLSKAKVNELFNFELTEEEIKAIFSKQDEVFADSELASWKKVRAIEKEIKEIIDVRTYTGWTTSGHTAVDVPVIAFGKHAAVFAGNQDNTDIAKKIFNLIDSTQQ
ncbi:alkaline phosphatase [Thalassotalea euphylliae]|uniref:alkaline phosphatase n=1 Tax=Thalassotalea euphylliae TaxID=1655234 RepID=UPI00363F1C6C